MALVLKTQFCDRQGLLDILDDMASRIGKDNFDFDSLCMIGILSGGALITEYLAKKVGELTGKDIPVAFVDITLYRDDMIDTAYDPYSRKTEIPFSLKNREVLLVDDVLFTGRTVRAALTSILSQARPRLIRLAAVVDRGFRELPIHADFVGVFCETTRNQGVRVRTSEHDQEPGIYIYEKEAPSKDV